MKTKFLSTAVVLLIMLIAANVSAGQREVFIIKVADAISDAVVDAIVEYLREFLMYPHEKEGSKQAEWRTDPAQSGIAGTIGDVGTLDFSQKKRCMEAGITATRQALPSLRAAIERYYHERGGAPPD